MITFLTGILILFFGYLFYSKFIEKTFSPDDRKTPATEFNDGVDFIPMSKTKNLLIHLLNIAGMGPILGAIQGILFGPVAFILIPLGCVFFGGVHDYFAGMISMRNKGLQITGLTEKYLGKYAYYVLMVIISIMLLVLAAVFVYTSGDLFAERFFNVKDFSFFNPVIFKTYLVITAYFVVAALFPIDKIIGRFYPFLGVLLILGTGLILVGFFIKGVNLQNIDFSHINMHPGKLPLIPMFFMTVSCGLLSGFHSTQATIISRTVSSEYHGKQIFYGMMCLESLIAMIWAAAATDVYSTEIIPQNIIGTVNVVNITADKFVPFNLAFLVTLAVIVLPITSGDTALRGFRIMAADALKLNQKSALNRLLITVPVVLCLAGIIYVAKTNSSGFSLVWRYFTFFNQLIAVPTLFYATVYLYKKGKNFLITLIPGLFYVFITSAFILNSNTGFNMSLKHSYIFAVLITFAAFVYLFAKMKNYKEKNV